MDLATHNCASIYLASLVCLDEQIRDCWNERKSVASHEVLVIEAPQLLSIVTPVKDKVYVNSHTERPVRVDAEEPKAR